jgi:hypothetical protein
MTPTKWGKFLWISLHLIALGYPDNPSEQEKKDYHHFFSNLYKILPCFKCSEHLVENLKKHPLHASMLIDSKSLFTWTVKLHNIVNEQLGKQQMSLDKAFTMYNSDDLTPYICEPCVTKYHTKDKIINKIPMYLWIILLLSILINIYYFSRVIMRRFK